MSVLKLKLQDNQFDAIISFDVLEHLNETDQEKFIH
jgi:2-polyprenyl-3-methyl-5-hydroxy-6-metoxy-1,4-benzoquinol methylase